MDKQLKPCPFCGGENIKLELEDEYDVWRVMCWRCNATIQIEGKEKAIKKWNRRVDNG